MEIVGKNGVGRVIMGREPSADHMFSRFQFTSANARCLPTEEEESTTFVCLCPTDDTTRIEGTCQGSKLR